MKKINKQYRKTFHSKNGKNLINLVETWDKLLLSDKPKDIDFCNSCGEDMKTVLEDCLGILFHIVRNEECCYIVDCVGEWAVRVR